MNSLISENHTIDAGSKQNNAAQVWRDQIRKNNDNNCNYPVQSECI